MVRVVGIDHIVIRVSDLKKSTAFYSKLFEFMGFKVLYELDDGMVWTNGRTRYGIGRADKKGRKHKFRLGNVGLHHYAFELGSRKDVDDLQSFLKKELDADIVDPAGEYYDDYYAVFFLDPDGMKLEGMRYGDLKKNVTEMVVSKLEPIQQRYQELMSDRAELRNTLNRSADRIRPIAESTMALVREKTGLFRG